MLSKARTSASGQHASKSETACAGSVDMRTAPNSSTSECAAQRARGSLSDAIKIEGISFNGLTCRRIRMRAVCSPLAGPARTADRLRQRQTARGIDGPIVGSVELCAPFAKRHIDGSLGPSRRSRLATTGQSGLLRIAHHVEPVAVSIHRRQPQAVFGPQLKLRSHPRDMGV